MADDAGGFAEKPMRIFVGGLGAGVTAEDMEKTFSSLGSVAVQLVRTNGRSFAYMDFHPNSDKSLARLFATYNGCMWKGGKLRVEKAKEHYLARLRREWVEDAKLNTTSSTPVDLNVEKNLNTSNKPQILNQENMQLNIYFPMLKKVKPLPFKGTGKHKYSFQRIEVPPFPIHFCDCEEHSMLSKTSSQKYLSCNNSVIHKKEISIMTAVMNKIFEKDGSASDRHNTLDTEANKSVSSDNEYMLEESDEASPSDLDNLLTNIGLQQQGDDALDQILLEELANLAENQESKSSKLHPSMNGITKTNIKSHKKQQTSTTSVPVNTLEQKFRAVLEEKVAEDECMPISLGKKTSKNCMKEVEMPADVLPIQSKAEPSKNIEPYKGHSWLQKSSWKDLVGEVGNSPFSISHVIPSINLAAQKSPISNGSDLAMPVVQKKRKVQFNNELEVKRRNSLAKLAASTHVEKTENGNKVQENPGEAAEGESRKKGSISTSALVDMLDHKSCAVQEGKATEDEQMTILPRKGTPQNCMKEVEMTLTVQKQTEPSENMEPSKGHTWLQKSSWKDLVGEVGNSSFSISHVIPGINSAAQKSPISNGSVSATSTVRKKRKVQSNNEGSTCVEVHKKSLAKQAAPTHVEKTENGDKVQENPGEVAQGEAGKKSNLVPRRIVPKIHVGEVCTFMRNAESEKEWTKAKAVLSGYLKKKGNPNDANKNAKGTLRHKA